MPTFDIDGRPVSWVRTGAMKGHPLFVFAHGAGAAMTHAFMEHTTNALVERGVCVVRFHFPYMELAVSTGKRRGPDPAARLLATWRAMLDRVKKMRTRGPVVIGGKSMGGRMASMLAAAEGHPGMTAITIAMIGMLVVLGVRRRRRRRADPVLAYHRATRRVRVRRDPHETPREFLARVRLTAGLPEDAIAELERVTRDHEAARFAPGATRGTPRSSESRRDPLRALAAR